MPKLLLRILRLAPQGDTYEDGDRVDAYAKVVSLSVKQALVRKDEEAASASAIVWRVPRSRMVGWLAGWLAGWLLAYTSARSLLGSCKGQEVIRVNSLRKFSLLSLSVQSACLSDLPTSCNPFST